MDPYQEKNKRPAHDLHSFQQEDLSLLFVAFAIAWKSTFEIFAHSAELQSTGHGRVDEVNTSNVGLSQMHL